jgi:uncharacterized protein (DUF433 family)
MDGLLHPDFPQIDLREAAAGRVAYVAGTRFAVYWIVQMVPLKMNIETFSREYGLPASGVQTALAYAQFCPEEIESNKILADANRRWIANADCDNSTR